MSSTTAGANVCLLLLVACARLSAQTSKPLESSDFTLTSLESVADTGSARRLLGSPDSVTTGDDPSGAAPLDAWWYRDVEIVFLPSGDFLGTWLRGPSRSTRRGLRLGANIANVQRLYGRPTNSYGDSAFVYAEPRKREGEGRMLYITGSHKTVKAIYLGRTID